MTSNSPTIQIPGWTEQPPYLYELHQTMGSWSPFTWKVTEKNNELFVTKMDKEPGSRKQPLQFEFDDGVFIGSDHGEWGGELLFQPSNSEKEEPYLLLRDNVVDLKKYREKIFVLTGSAHLTHGWGTVTVLMKKYGDRKEQWTISEKIDLSEYLNLNQNGMIYPSEPKALFITDLGIYVITPHCLIHFSQKTMSLEKVYQVPLFLTYPSLYIFQDQIALIGTSYGLVTIELGTEKTHLFIPEGMNRIQKRLFYRKPAIPPQKSGRFLIHSNEPDQYSKNQIAKVVLHNSYPLSIDFKSE